MSRNVRNRQPERRSARWFITINNPDETTCSRLLGLGTTSSLKRAVWQLERGESGTEHIQGVFEFKSRVRFELAKRTIGDTAHLEPSRNWEAAYKYCTKSETRVSGPWAIGCDLPVRSRITELREWQRNLGDKLEKDPDDRTVEWWYDQEGGSGKTAFAKWWYLKHPDQTIILSGKTCDCKYAVSSMSRAPKWIFYTLTRSQEGFVSYQAIEELKDGVFFNSKYESKMFVMEPPHIVVFANFAPDETKLSIDRWNIVNIHTL